MKLLEKLGVKAVNPGVYIAGAEVVTYPENEQVVNSFNPSTNDRLSSIIPCSGKDYSTLITTVSQSIPGWQEVPPQKRGQIIQKIGQAFQENKQWLSALISLETGKVKKESEAEVQEIIDMANFAYWQSGQIHGKKLYPTEKDHSIYEHWCPHGIVGIITPFNYPMAIWARGAFMAAITGNMTVWKASTKAPLCAIAVQKICDQIMAEVGYPGVFSLFIPPNRKFTETFTHDQRISLFHFSGSIKVGKHVNQIIAGRLGRVILEISGHNSVIVDESADLNQVIPAITAGVTGIAGQRCTAIKRVVVHQNLKNELIGRLVHSFRQITIGDPMEVEAAMGPLIDSTAVKSYQQLLKDVVQYGGKVCYGGKVIKSKGNFVEPTIVDIKRNCEIIQKETFAPVLYVLGYTGFYEALSANYSNGPEHTSTLFSKNQHNIDHFLSIVADRCNVINVNTDLFFKNMQDDFDLTSNPSRFETSPNAWRAYMKKQLMTINRQKTDSGY